MNPRSPDKVLIKIFTVGPMAVNCYLVADTRSKEAALIDPGAAPQDINKFVKKNGFVLKFIINTHGHGDHIAANGFFSVPIYIHKADADFLADPDKNLSAMFLFSVKSPSASRLLDDGDKVKLGAHEFEVIHTPGHTPGSIALKLGNVIFSGDTLFRGGIGRTDFVYGDEQLIIKSIEKLMRFADDTVLYPGHGDATTVGNERGTNPFLIE